LERVSYVEIGFAMTLNELRYIVAVARERHFGRAAEACFVSQPTLSVAVKKLEEELGISLFERGTGEVTVTAVGQQVVEQAQRVLEEADGVKRLALRGKDPLAGPLRLGAIYTIGPYLLPQLVAWVSEQAPDMPLIIEENFTAVLSERLKRGDLDVIIISLPFDEPGVLTRPLYDEPFAVLLPGSHPWSGRDSVDAEQLGGEEVLLLGPGHCFRDQVLQVCPNCVESSSRGGGLQRGFEGGSLETIRCMVASGVGITVLPCSAVAADRFSGPLVRALPFAGTAPRRGVALAWRKSFPRIEAVDVLARAVQAADLECVTYREQPR
jgi:LysR family hydrogen peroxide-inducible transcriptional activator